jgi:radical SAM protein with 4Fe4S-binding SPASM domain
MDVKFAITNKCNLRCRHCHYSAAASAPDELTTAEAKDAIDQVAELWDEVKLTLTGGEALLRNDCFELASHASSKIGHVDFASNGVCIDAEIVRSLADSGVKQVIIGFDGVGEAHNGIRGKGSFAKAVKGAEAVRAGGLDLLISHCITTENPFDFRDVLKLADDLGAKTFITFHYIPLGRGVEDLPDAGPDDFFAQNLMELYEQQQQHKELEICTTTGSQYWVVLRRMHEQGLDMPGFFERVLPGCRAGKGMISIRDNGDVMPCPLLQIKVGNLRDSSLEDIMQTKIMQEIREHRNFKGKCGSCKHNDICGGCRVRAYGYFQDYLAEDPLCSDFFFEKG